MEGRSIRFGLCAIKNVGQSAVESIVEARKEHGTFEDVFGLCEHIDLRLVNKRVLESLIQAGACDSLEGHRAQLMDVLDTVIEGAQTRTRTPGRRDRPPSSTSTAWATAPGWKCTGPCCRSSSGGRRARSLPSRRNCSAFT